MKSERVFVVEFRAKNDPNAAWQRSYKADKEYSKDEAFRLARNLQKSEKGSDYRVSELERRYVRIEATEMKDTKVTLRPNTIKVNGDEAEGTIEWQPGGTGYTLRLDLACGDHVEVEFSMGLLGLAVNEAQERAGVHKNRRWSRKDGTVYRD